MELLKMEGICKSFSGNHANENVDLTVSKGEIHALLGENGAGKTTLMNILFGIYQADSGRILWKGEEVRFPSPKEALASGIGMVHQHFSLINNMTVLDNVLLSSGEKGLMLNREEGRRRLAEHAKRYGLAVDPSAKVSTLSVGEMQRVEIIKTLCRDVELLILDEPTAVLTPQETDDLFEVLRSLKAEGYGIIMITHRMSEIMAVSDKVTILRDGRSVAHLDTSETTPEELARHMIGREIRTSFVHENEPEDEIMLSLEGVGFHGGRKRKSISGLSLDVRKGEILGIAGVEGNGQKEIAELITGIIHPSSGKVVYRGSDITRKGARERYEEGISYISDDRLKDSLIPAMDVAENISLREYKNSPVSGKWVMNRDVMREKAAELIGKFDIRTGSDNGPAVKVADMSGGNQQKVIIARELSDKANLIVACQPTRGLDIGATEFVRDELTKVRNAGKSVILISADLEEITALSDRIAVLYNGRIAGVLAGKDADIHRIGLYMGGISGDGTENV